VAGSASIKGSTLTVTLVNSHATETTESTVRLLGGILKAVTQTTGLEFPAGDIQAHNTFENPSVVTLASQDLVVSSDAAGLVVSLPPASVTKLTLEI
jgi:alpha-L-arabinofuranosidase